MIESVWWREELRADIRWLKEKRRYKRWSEKQLVLFERRLILVACQLRTLLERHKVSRLLRSRKVTGLRYDKIGERAYTITRGGADLHEYFDVNSPVPIEMSARDLCNQLLHHYVLMTSSEVQGRFTAIAVFSDYKRHTCLYEFKVADLIEFFEPFADKDAGNYGGGTIVWNEARLDYDLLPLDD